MKELRTKKKELKEELKIVLMAAGILSASDDNLDLRRKYLSEERYYRDEIFRINTIEESIKEAYKKSFIEGYKTEAGDCWNDEIQGEEFEKTIEKAFRKTYKLDEEDEIYSDGFKDKFEEIFTIAVKEMVNVALGIGLQENRIREIMLLGIEEVENM